MSCHHARCRAVDVDNGNDSNEEEGWGGGYGDYDK